MTITDLPALDEPCQDCPTDGERKANGDAWKAWGDREAGAYSYFANLYRRDFPHGSPMDAWERSQQYHDLVAEQPPEFPERGCYECNYTGLIPTDAGRALLAFLSRHDKR